MLKNVSGQRFPINVTSNPTIKDNAELESPWDTAVRKTYEDIEYWDSKNDKWCAYNITEHLDHIQHRVYMECTVEHKTSQLVGLFIIRLAGNILFRPREPNVSRVRNYKNTVLNIRSRSLIYSSEYQ